jgi:hypothetical protein
MARQMAQLTRGSLGPVRPQERHLRSRGRAAAVPSPPRSAGRRIHMKLVERSRTEHAEESPGRARKLDETAIAIMRGLSREGQRAPSRCCSAAESKARQGSSLTSLSSRDRQRSSVPRARPCTSSADYLMLSRAETSWSIVNEIADSSSQRMPFLSTPIDFCATRAGIRRPTPECRSDRERRRRRATAEEASVGDSRRRNGGAT